MIKIGMLIGERYEILEKIGTGGMSDVYKAKCHKLNRFVAVKVLKQEFSENANFVSKFRIEAQAAAGLMHPNIVNVYDVGEENGIHYIVMELVEGITLKKYIEKKARLSYKEAVSIALQVSMGIEAAHNNHIIHRDIKPQNIIISKEGKVKVTDFGIAKAATSNTITSNVMGSVHYTSPEQARGGYSDEKSDVYSLGITMFEMLTGRVPFNGETTVAIAIKHIQEELPSPKDFVAEIPGSVAQIVLKCCQKSPDRRYQNMGELIVDLKQALMRPEEDFVVFQDVEAENSTRFISSEDMEQMKTQTGRGNTEELMRLRVDTESAAWNDKNEEESENDGSNSKAERITTILAIVTGVAIIIIILVMAGKIAALFQLDNTEDKVIDGTKQTESSMESTEVTETEPESETEPEQVPVSMISVAGMTLSEATDALRELGLHPEVEYMESDAYEEGIVISADVAVGTKLEPGTIVNLTVSSGTQGVVVPNVQNVSYESAFNSLAGKGFVVNKIESYSSSVEKGNVIYQNPAAGTKAPEGSFVTVTVSLGKEDTQVRVPNLMGVSEDEAVALIIESGLAVGNTSQIASSQYEEGVVCYQSYSYGAYVERGTAIDIKVSMGPETVTYKLNASIAAPTVAEAPDYVAGSPVKVTITTVEGKLIMDTTATAFPVSANGSGIPSPSGIITFTYTVTTQGTSTINPDTGEEITTPGTTEEKTFTRTIEFVKE